MALLGAVASEAAGPATLHIPVACLAAMADGVSASRRPAETSVRKSTAILTTVIDDQYRSASPTPGLSTCCHVARLVSDAVGLAGANMSVSAWQCKDKRSLTCLSRQPNSPVSHQPSLAEACRLVPKLSTNGHSALCARSVLRRLR